MSVLWGAVAQQSYNSSTRDLKYCLLVYHSNHTIAVYISVLLDNEKQKEDKTHTITKTESPGTN